VGKGGNQARGQIIIADQILKSQRILYISPTSSCLRIRVIYTCKVVDDRFCGASSMNVLCSELRVAGVVDSRCYMATLVPMNAFMFVSTRTNDCAGLKDRVTTKHVACPQP
jgi:hypothetical protein